MYNTGHNYSPPCDVSVKISLFPDLLQNFCRKTIEATIMKKVLNKAI